MFEVTPLTASYIAEWALFLCMAIAFFLIGWNAALWKTKREQKKLELNTTR